MKRNYKRETLHASATFSQRPRWQIVTGSNLGSPLTSLFYPLVTACRLGLLWKCCRCSISHYKM